MYGATWRPCIYVRNHINVLLLLEFCSRDVAMVRILYSTEGNQRELILTLAYLPYDSDEPPPLKELRDITDYCSSSRKQLIIGYDVNAHHILWGSTDIKQREESLVEFLVSSNLNILNPGNEPTFVISNRREVTDFTLGTDWIGNLVRSWHVSDNMCRITDTFYSKQGTYKVTFRDPKRTVWESYVENLTLNLGTTPHYVCSIKDVELAADWIQQSIPFLLSKLSGQGHPLTKGCSLVE
jgi:hypothetical protein